MKTPLSYITIEVDGHKVKVTTDQAINPQYIKELTAHIRKVEAEKTPKKPHSLS